MFGIEQEYQYHVRDMGRSYVGNKQMLIDNKHLFMDKERKRSRSLYVANVSKIYPDITAEKLLKMICIAMKYKNAYRFVNGIEDLKEQTLEILISLKGMVSIYAELQQLFTE